jgi:uncharacterized protein
MKLSLIFLLFTPLAMIVSPAPPPQAWKAGLNHVEFPLEGSTVVATLFLPDSYQPGQRLPTVLVDGPWTQIKEQVGYRYGQELSQRGFAVLAIDHRNFGESGGAAREFESPAMKAADLRAAVEYLKTNPAVDARRIGLLGVCFGASYSARMLAEGNPGVKAYATVAAWLHDVPSLTALYTPAGMAWRREMGEAALAAFQKTGTVQQVPAYHPTERAAMMGNVPYYARHDRGMVPQWHNRFATMSWVEWLKMDAVHPYAGKINIPTLMVHSDKSALPANVRTFYGLLAGPKELKWTEGEHTEFYDKDEQVTDAADAVAAHFHRTL